MAGTAKRKNKKAKPGSRFPSKILADNVKFFRQVSEQVEHKEDVSQNVLALRMQALGHDWDRTTVSSIETERRAVDIDEAIALAVCLEVSLSALLDPRFTSWTKNDGIDLGNGTVVPSHGVAGTLHAISDEFGPDGSHAGGIARPHHSRLTWDLQADSNGDETRLVATFEEWWDGGFDAGLTEDEKRDERGALRMGA